MAKYELKPHEESFELKPIGIRYRCEHCNEGEMKYDEAGDHTVVLDMGMPRMYPHVCTHCGGKLYLPKIYPFVAWEPVNQ